MIIDINFKSEDELEKRLSNFTECHFIFDDYECRSIEGPLQAIKTKLPILQKRICQMRPRESHRLYKKAHDDDWQVAQKLCWKGSRFNRCSAEHNLYITRLFDAAFEQSESFRDSLTAAIGYELQHTIGKYHPSKTVLTIPEFLGQLYRLQTLLM